MRHAKNSQRLSLPSEHREAVLNNLVRSLITHNEVRTTFAKAKQAQRLADRLVTLGKEGSIHARRRAFRVLQDRALVKRLFGDIAPRFLDAQGGYTRVTRLALRRGDGALLAQLALSRLPAGGATPAVRAKPESPSQEGPAPQTPQAKKAEEGEKPKRFFDGLRNILTRKKKGSAAT